MKCFILFLSYFFLKICRFYFIILICIGFKLKLVKLKTLIASHLDCTFSDPFTNRPYFNPKGSITY